MGWIYIFFCLVDYKVYIGKWSGRRIEYRRNKHINGYGNQHLYRAIQKHGWKNFIFDVLHENIPKEKLNDLERKEIARFNCNSCRPGGWGYNKTDGGEGTIGFVQSAEHRQKISDALKGESNPNYGKPAWNKGKPGQSHSVGARQKISDALKGESNPNYGKPRSAEARRKQSIAMKGKNVGKRRSAKTRQKLSKANRHPEYERARVFFYIDLANVPIKEKRKKLFAEFTDVAKVTLYKWAKDWQTELAT